MQFATYKTWANEAQSNVFVLHSEPDDPKPNYTARPRGLELVLPFMSPLAQLYTNFISLPSISSMFGRCYYC